MQKEPVDDNSSYLCVKMSEVCGGTWHNEKWTVIGYKTDFA